MFFHLKNFPYTYLIGLGLAVLGRTIILLSLSATFLCLGALIICHLL